MGKPIVISVLGDVRDLTSNLGTAEGRLSKFGGAAGKVGKVIAGGLLVAGAAAGAFAVKAVSAASDAQQSVGATETVYGKYADTVIKKSGQAARSVGLSANAYRENSNLLGALLKNQGVAQDKLAGKTSNLISVSADLAATYGGTTTTAVEAMSAAYKGEFNQLEKYGISLKASTIQAELAARGQDKLTGAALDAAKQQATTDLITRQAGDALGAFGRETGTFAHQQQVAGAQLENLAAKAGGLLLPVLTTLMAFANDTLIPGLERIGPPVASFAAVVADQAAPVIATLGQFLTGTLVPALTAFGGYVVGTVIPAARDLAGTVAANLAPILTTVVSVVTDLVGKFRGWSPQIMAVAGDVGRLVARLYTVASAILGTVLPPAIRFAGFLIGVVVPAVVGVIGVLVKVVNGVLNFGAALVDGVREAGKFAAGILDKIGKAVGYVQGIPDKITGALSGAGTLLKGIGQDIVNGLIEGLDSGRQWIIDKIQALGALIPGWLKRKLGIASPSKVTALIGRQTGQGLVAGLVSQFPALRNALDTAAGLVAGTTMPALSLAAGVGGGAPRARFTSAAAARAGGAPVLATVTLRAEHRHDLDRGRDVALELRTYTTSGFAL